MKGLYLEKRFDILLLMLAACFPIYMYSISGILLPAFSLVSLYMYYQQKGNFNISFSKKKLCYFFITTGFYFLMLSSLLYSSNLKAGVSFLFSREIYILIYPLIIIFYVNRVSKKHLYLILFCFVFSCCLYMLYIHYSFYQAGLYIQYKKTEFNYLPFRDVLMGLKFAKGHPTYVSMWFLFSSLFLIYFLLENKVTFYKKTGLILIVVSLFFSSVLFSAKIAVIAFFFSLLLLIYLMVKNRWVVVLSLAVVVVFFSVALFNVSLLKARFIDEFNATELAPPVGLNTNSLNIRVGIYECSIETFKNNWLLGIGIGDVQNELNHCYNRFDTNVYKEDKYDTHNQYLHIAVATGTVGLTCFILMLGFHIKESIRYNNYLFLVFLLFVIICMFPENILNRNNGVVFYSLFGSLLLKRNLEKDKS